MSLQRRQIFRNSLHSVGSSDSLPGRKSLFCPSWCDAHSAVWALPWFLSRASPGVALLLLVWVWSSWTVPVSFGVPVLPALLISVASCRVSPEGFCARGSEAALPRLSWRIFLLCSTAGVGLSLRFRAEWSPGGRIYDDAVGQKVSKALWLHFTQQCLDRSA